MLILTILESRKSIYRVFIKYCVFPKNSQKFASTRLLLVVHKKGQPIRGTVQSYCVENFEGLLQRYVGEGGVAVNCEKHNFS